MRVKEFFYCVNGVTYPVYISRKRMKNITFHFHDDAFYISAPWYANKKDFIEGLDKYSLSLIQKANKDNKGSGDNFIYLLGDKYDIAEQGVLQFGEMTITYKSRENLDNKLKKWFLNYMTMRVKFYTEIMCLELYKVRVQKMRSRYGSNSKHTKTINFALILMHYSPEIIDSVVVHELAHIVVFNHSRKFYNYVYEYCPQYDYLRKKLIKGEFR